MVRLNRRGRIEHGFGGGDGILNSGVAGGIGAEAWEAVQQSPKTLTMAGYVDVKGRYGGAEQAAGMVRFNLKAKDGRTKVTKCR